MAKRQSFFSELKRRNVLRAAVLYAGAIWALGQGLSQFSPALGLTDWVTRWFLIAAVIGFPFWVAFAWFYEFTPQGIKRESEVAPNASITHSTARKLDFAIIGVMAVAIVLLGSGYFIRRHAPAAIAAQAAFNPATDTLVVLPFQNLSGDSKQQYFSDGITEELTDALGQNPALRVIAWDTASRYRNSSESAKEIGKALNVAHILHGSIARAGDQVRITTELVDARTGYQVWSQHYDDSFANIFKVQDQVSQSIAQALQVKLAQVDLPAGGTRNPQAHELVLKGRALINKPDAKSLDAARQDFEQALVLDPDYADAHALLARALLDLTERSDLPLKTTLPAIRAHAQKALALDPRNADAWVALANADANADPPDIAKARTEYQKALALDPSNEAAHLGYGNVLPLKSALAETREATLLDPANAAAWNNLVVCAQDLGDWAQMNHAAETLLRLDPTDVDSAVYLAYAYQQLHQSDKVLTGFDRVQPATDLDKQQVAAGRLVYRAIQDPALRPQALDALADLSRHQSNQDVAGNLLQMYLALGKNASALQLLENFCPANPVACSDLAISPMYRALRADPRFQQLAKKYTTMTLE
ncbi:MAG: tetratricopeptide repeat protein [Rhodanobacteraceae bacterium]